jgi:predicted permease
MPGLRKVPQVMVKNDRDETAALFPFLFFVCSLVLSFLFRFLFFSVFLRNRRRKTRKRR